METPSDQSRMAQLSLVATAGLFALAVMTGTQGSNLALGAGAVSPIQSAGRFTSGLPNDNVVEQTITDMWAAIGRHDMRSYHMFRADLVDRIGLATVEAALQKYRDVLANLAAANRRHDSRAQASFRAQIAHLCGPETLLIEPGRCDIAVAAARL
jgi:hypothetical protein